MKTILALAVLLLETGCAQWGWHGTAAPPLPEPGNKLFAPSEPGFDPTHFQPAGGISSYPPDGGGIQAPARR